MTVYWMTDIPRDELQEVIDGYIEEGYTVAVIKQDDNLFTVEARKQSVGEGGTTGPAGPA